MAERCKVKGESPGAFVHKLFPSFVSLPPTPMLDQALNWRVGSYPATQCHLALCLRHCVQLRIAPLPL